MAAAVEWRVREGAMSTGVVAYLVEEETPFLSSSNLQGFLTVDSVVIFSPLS